MPETDRASGLGLFAAAVAFLLPVAFEPAVASSFWTPKAALIPLVAAVGGVLLLGSHTGTAGRSVNCLPCAFVVVAAISTLLAGRVMSITGHYGWGTGLIFVVALAGAWAVGVNLTAHDARLFGRALLTGISVNVVVVFLEMRFDLSSLGLVRAFGRAQGLMGNPVYLGPLLVAGWCSSSRRSPPPGARPTGLGGSVPRLPSPPPCRSEKRGSLSCCVPVALGRGVGSASARPRW